MFDLDLLFQKSELIPVIIQDSKTKTVLMLGFTNREAVDLTLATGTAWFWSRSRNKLWNKGESSGNFLHVEKILTDAEEDASFTLGNAITSLILSAFTKSITKRSRPIAKPA